MNQLVVYLLKNNNDKMIKYVTENIEVDMEIDIELEDVLEFIKGANESEVSRIKSEVDSQHENLSGFVTNTLYDVDKVLILKEAMKRYNLYELVEKLGISQADALQ